MLLATHDLEQVFALADRIVVLRDGARRRRRVPGGGAPQRRRGADVRGRGRLHRQPPAPAAAEPGRPAVRGRAGRLAPADRVGDGRRARAWTCSACTCWRPPASRPVLRRLRGDRAARRELLAAERGACRSARRAARPGWPRRAAPSWWWTTCKPGPPGRGHGRRPPRPACGAPGPRPSWAATACWARCPATPPRPGNPAPERLELATIYLRYAASAIERERLLTEVSRRNRVLESLRGLLESLAGPGTAAGRPGDLAAGPAGRAGRGQRARWSATDGDGLECRCIAHRPAGPA